MLLTYDRDGIFLDIVGTHESYCQNCVSKKLFYSRKVLYLENELKKIITIKKDLYGTIKDKIN